MTRALILRHSFSNPWWWGYHLYALPWYHMRYNGVRY
jgi:hypothetical protein